jgi:hypothetical protein
LLAASLATGCGDNSVAPPPDDGPAPQWSELIGFPPDVTFYGAWAAAPDYVMAVGPLGLVSRWDGTQWTQVTNESTRNLWAIAGATGNAIVAVGDYGAAVRFDGTRFVLVSTPTSEHLRGLWRSPSGAFIAVGGGGAIIRGDGMAWTLDTTPTLASLFGVWGSADDDVFAVGLDGTILHFDGTDWSEMASGTTAILASVSGTAPDDVYAVGTSGTILHYDGSAWTPMTSGTTDVLQGVWAPGGPIAVGANGTVVTLDADVWTSVANVTHAWLYAVARAGSRVWALGNRTVVSTADGSAWTQPTRGLVPLLNAVVGGASGPLTTVGNGGYAAQGNGDSWAVTESGTSRALNAAWVEPSGDVYAAGLNRILHYDGATWTSEFEQPVEFLDIAGGPSGLIAVGTAATIYRRVAGTWYSMRPTTPVSATLRAYASVADNIAYIVGDAGMVLRYNGITWQPTPSGFSTVLYDVAAVSTATVDAMAVGEAGTIIAHNPGGSAWHALPSPTGVTLRALARGPHGDLFAVGGAGTVIRYDGTAWSVVPSPTSTGLRSAWSRSGILFVVGGQGTANVVLRYGRP